MIFAFLRCLLSFTDQNVTKSPSYNKYSHNIFYLEIEFSTSEFYEDIYSVIESVGKNQFRRDMK
jgi:hypothetical protein